MCKSSLYIAFGLSIFAVTGFTQPDAVQTQSTSQLEVMDQHVELPNPESDEPVSIQKMGFVLDFVEKLKRGQSVSDMMVPVLDFAYYENNKCGDRSKILIPDLEAQKIDTTFRMATVYSSKTATCEDQPRLRMDINFNLKEHLLDWDSFDAAADDHNYETFYISGKGTSEHIMVSIGIHEDRYAFYRFEYYIDE